MKIAIACFVVALAAAAHARVTATQPPVSAHITSLSDKDARSKAKIHPAFANAGQRAGVEIWRIENFDPVAVPAADYGKFYKGDSYIVLKTTADKRNNLAHDIHYWIGAESSQDESGAAAILTVGLDDKFNGAAVQYREPMGYESDKFKGYFQPGHPVFNTFTATTIFLKFIEMPPYKTCGHAERVRGIAFGKKVNTPGVFLALVKAIRYLDGGHASGFNHVTTNPGAEKRLFQVKGKRNVRVRQVGPQTGTMNEGDVFILDVDQSILVYVGKKARNVEKLKAISFANQIRDQDHNGRGRVDIIDQYSSEVDVQNFFTALGSGAANTVPEESAGGDDLTFEKNEEQIVTLSEVAQRGKKFTVTPLSKPLRQESLQPQNCYILDTVSGSIYVWVGKQSTPEQRQETMNKAQQLISSKSYPSWVKIVMIPQGTEPAAFKQYFSTWRDVGMSHNRLV